MDPQPPSLEELDLSGCNLTWIHSDAFQFLPPPSFRLLNLSFNPQLLTGVARREGHFRVRSLLHGLRGVAGLQSLDLSGLGLATVTNETFDFLSTTRLAELRLRQNELVHWDDRKIGQDLKLLRKLDLSHNYIESVRGLDVMTKLEEVRGKGRAGVM